MVYKKEIIPCENVHSYFLYLNFFKVCDKLKITTKCGQGEVEGKENRETLDAQISLGIDKLNKEIFISTSRLGRSMEHPTYCKKS